MKKKYTLSLAAIFGMTAPTWAQSSGSMNNPYYLLTIVLFIILLIMALALPKVIKTLADQVKKKNKGNLLLLLIGLGMGSAHAGTESIIGPEVIQNIDVPAFLLILACFILIITFYTLFKTMNNLSMMLKSEEELALERAKPTLFNKLMSRLDDAKSVEEEGDIMLDHEYDGIRELDNNLPPWWIALFYITIIWSVVYLANIYIFDNIPGQEQEYAMEVKAAEKAMESYKATATDLIDENTVELLTSKSDLTVGAKLYTSLCAACHGANGEGLVGPNLTDEFWKHGGGVKNIFSSIKYGIPDKGMIAWKSQLKPAQIQKITSYIISLEGSNPAKAKAAEGDKWIPEE